MLKYNINLIVKPPAILEDLIDRKFDSISNCDKAGVCIIPFSTQHQKSLPYVGMTSRKFKERLKEYLSDSNVNNSSTAFARLHKKYK